MARGKQRVREILRAFERGESVRRQCRRCKGIFQIFALELSIPDYLCQGCLLELDCEVGPGPIEKGALVALSQCVVSKADSIQGK